MGDYTYLFPFEKIEPHSKVLIYGAGNTGINYIEQIIITKYCEIMGVVDKNAASIPKMVVPVFGIEEVKNLSFDYIIIAMKTPIYNEKIISDFRQINIPLNKIVFVGGRKKIESIYVDESKKETKSLAIHKKGISMAIQIPSGIGDVIISKRLIQQLLTYTNDLNIDIYCSNELAQVFYDENDNINSILTPQVEMFNKVYPQYDIAISVRFYITFYSFKYDEIKKQDAFFADLISSLYSATEEYNSSCAVNERLRIFYERANYANKSVFCYPNYYEKILGIRDSNVYVPLREEWQKEFERQHIYDYITVNYGNAIDSSNVSKQWPLEKFSKLVYKLKKHYHRMKVIQLGALEADKILNCDEYLLGKNLELVKYVLLNSLLHIDIEGGLVHVATQLGTKCVVLFGPTSMNAFGYPQNINIKAGDCHNCCGVESDIYKCARHLDIPACMDAISVDMVYKEVDNYLSNIL